MGEMDKNRMIGEILETEWGMFVDVNNIGGTADCQRDQETFIVMRGAYYLAWDEPSLASFVYDIQQAEKAKRNLVMEKYARMMEYSDPAYYESRLKPYLPELDGEIKQLAKRIAEMYLVWETEFSKTYPNLGARGRALTTGALQDETGEREYLMGELQTYSHQTLTRYLSHLTNLKRSGINPIFQVKEAVVRHGGYGSLMEAEARMGGNPI